MRSGSSELLLDQQQQELRKRKLKELAPKKKNVTPRKRTFRENISFYSTSTLAFFSVTAGASLLFLVPLYVDPAISTLVSNFIDTPTQCTTLRRDNMIGLFNCSWSSCREGCTSDLYRCTHIYVTYIEINDTSTNSTYDILTSQQQTNLTTDFEASDEAMLFVNIKGCGYPPSVSCSNFIDTYGTEGTKFPCYYSRLNKTIVMTSYKREDQVAMIIHFFVVPFFITLISSIGLCIMHCDCRCKKEIHHRRRHHRRRPRIENLRLVLFFFIICNLYKKRLILVNIFFNLYIYFCDFNFRFMKFDNIYNYCCCFFGSI